MEFRNGIIRAARISGGAPCTLLRSRGCPSGRRKRRGSANHRTSRLHGNPVQPFFLCAQGKPVRRSGVSEESETES